MDLFSKFKENQDIINNESVSQAEIPTFSDDGESMELAGKIFIHDEP